ncbi:MAG: DNA polymerase I [Pirellulaceae bacterium]|nr:DNA polymerase I [Pirellulaceae bacterium]
MPAKLRQQTFAAFDEPPPKTAAVKAPEVPAASIAPPMEVPFDPERPLAGKRVYVVDSHSLIYQVFHALPEMSGPSGQPVGAVHGFVRDLLDLIELRGADFLVAALDHPGPTFRHTLYEDYKSSREPMPADLQLQMPVISRFLEALGIPTLSVAGFEADDILATVARQVEAAGGECFLVTSDKDCRQLLSDQVRMFNIRKGEFFDANSLRDTWGIRPDQVVDFQSLVGDSVDDIPGVPGIGPKNASELLTKYENLEGIFAHVDEVSGAKRKENLKNGQATALASRQLARLATDVPVAVDWSVGPLARMQPDAVAELCRECGFRQIARRLESLAKKNGVQPATAPDSPATTDAATETVVQAPSAAEELTTADSPAWNATYRTIATATELAQLVAAASSAKQLSVDTETTSVHPRFAEIVGYSLAWKPGEAYYIPVRAPAGEPQLEPAVAADVLRPLLENPAIAKIGQNLKYDQIVLRGAGIELRGIAFDTMVADYLLDPGERSHNMDDMARRHLRHQTITIDQLIGTGKKQRRMDEVAVPLITQYAAEDADVPLRLASVLAPRLVSEELHDLFTNLEMPLIDVLADMEYTGITVDVGRLRELSGQFNERIMRLESEIHALAGREFNIDSPKQLAELFFTELKLPVLKRTKTGPSTDAEVLEELAAIHPLPAKIMEYRHSAKLKGTYIDALQELVHPATRRVHTSFKQDVAATGRLSSQDPNLQNIPIRTAEGRAIRSAFKPGPPGWLLLTADYSQIELRVLAHFSGDATLRQAFADDRDIHAQVASEVHGVSLDQVTSEMRRAAKAVNFGVIYGQSPFGLAKSLGISKPAAAQFIDRYFAGYPGVDGFLLGTLREARQRGFVSTILGRRRPVTGVRDPDSLADQRQRNLPERIAINTVIQGSAADIIKRAMISVSRRLAREGLAAKMLLQIHDELVFEFPPEEQERLTALVTEEMAAAASLNVPLKVDLNIGADWAACD